MRKTVNNLVINKKNELHENVTVTPELAKKEIDHVIQKTSNETLFHRYKRLSEEAEHLNHN